MKYHTPQYTNTYICLYVDMRCHLHHQNSGVTVNILYMTFDLFIILVKCRQCVPSHRYTKISFLTQAVTLWLNPLRLTTRGADRHCIYFWLNREMEHINSLLVWLNFVKRSRKKNTKMRWFLFAVNSFRWNSINLIQHPHNTYNKTHTHFISMYVRLYMHIQPHFRMYV